MIDETFTKYLFNHHYFVDTVGSAYENAAEVRLALANLFNIRISAGAEHLQQDMINLASSILGVYVPEPFYRGFPKSVRNLQIETLVIDQILHYYRTYGLGDFSEAGHSLFEEETERKAFHEDDVIRDFEVLTEAEALEKMREFAAGMLSGTRPLSDEQYDFLLAYISEYRYRPQNCASKSTAIRLLKDTEDLYFASFLQLSDVIKLADELNFSAMVSRLANWRNEVDPRPGGKYPSKLNLGNHDRKLITAVIDRLIADDRTDLRNCYERKALWSGLLHHIHYKTKDPRGIEFVKAMRGKGNLSVPAEFEKALAEKGPSAAADVLLKTKGSGMLLRSIDHLLSRCRTDEEVREIIGKIDISGTAILIQLLLHYADAAGGLRTFRFIRHGMMKKHAETRAEAARRRTVLSGRDRDAAESAIAGLLRKKLANRLGRVYIDPAMKKTALPLNESAGQGGFGTLNTGSRIPLPEGKKIRAFTYWEKVDDIDLSVIGIDDRLEEYEFSWRTMSYRQSEGITFSGDETSGYTGGSEYFDIDTEKFLQNYPRIRYLVFSSNIYSTANCLSFRDCTCTAGYMLRDIEDSGEVFEPKTVKSSFRITCDSTFAYLFGLDLTANEFVWLNIGNSGSLRVAAEDSAAFLIPYFNIPKVINVYDAFRMMASETVDDPKNADVAVTDAEIEAGPETLIIRSYDSEKITALLNS